MYHVVLIMALGGSGQMPVVDAGPGCCGCTRTVVVSEGCTGCSSCSCHGAYPGLFDRLRERWGRGCYGGHIIGCQECVDCGPSATLHHPSMGEVPTDHLVPMPAGPEESTAPAPKMEELPAPKPKDRNQAAAPAPAIILVHVPAEAILSVDGKPTQLTSTTREFTSPPLPPGQEFTYTFQAEVERDGLTLTAARRVTIHAGQQLSLDLDIPAARLAQK